MTPSPVERKFARAARFKIGPYDWCIQIPTVARFHLVTEQEKSLAENLADAISKAHESAVAETVKEAVEKCEKIIRDACTMCSGTGQVGGSTSGHGCGGNERKCAGTCPVEVEGWIDCEYCGRPIDAIRRAQGATHG